MDTGDRKRPAHPSSADAGSAGDAFVDEALDWFVRLQAGNNDPAVQRAFRAWCDSDPRRAAAFAKVAAMWGEPEFLRAVENVARETKFPARGKPRASARRQRTALIVGAVILIWGAASVPDIIVSLRADYMTATGERRTITLPDGSQMLLNTATAVSVDFAEDKREVTVLRGEAYFDVAKDRARPFVVDGNFSRVAVTGTAFDVRLDSDEDDVTLARGQVDVARLDRPADRTSLQPGQAVNVSNIGIAPVRAVDTSTALAWVDGRISFTERPFGEVLRQLRRHYRGRVLVLSPRLGDVAVSGSYLLDDPGQAIRSLAEAAGGSVTVLPGLIVLR